MIFLIVKIYEIQPFYKFVINYLKHKKIISNRLIYPLNAFSKTKCNLLVCYFSDQYMYYCQRLFNKYIYIGYVGNWIDYIFSSKTTQSLKIREIISMQAVYFFAAKFKCNIVFCCFFFKIATTCKYLYMYKHA